MKKYRKSIKILSIFFILLIVVLGMKLVRFVSAVRLQTGLTPIILFQLVTNDIHAIQNTDGKTNILLLGMGGGDHEGADLTDTLMVGSLDQKTQSFSLISIPRDVWSDTLKDKINSAYHYGEVKKQGGGIVLSQAIVEDVIGLPIHYTIVINFSQFMKIVDAIGGIDVPIAFPFIDTEYPIAGKENDLCNGDLTYRCRYETITFLKGVQHLNGEMTLKYIRSRHAEGDEGTDFARGRRQQDVILAIKEKLYSLKLWFKPALSYKLYQTIREAMQTTMTFGDELLLGRFLVRMDITNIKRISLEPQLMVGPQWMYDRYVLIPKESFESLHQYIKEEFLR